MEEFIEFGRHKGTRYTRIPVSYLRWLAKEMETQRPGELAAAELTRRGMSLEYADIKISGHAIDSASLRCLNIYSSTRRKNEGLHAWLTRIVQENATVNTPNLDHVYVGRMRLVIENDNGQLILKTVIVGIKKQRQSHEQPTGELNGNG